jgi:hypothetical protein
MQYGESRGCVMVERWDSVSNLSYKLRLIELLVQVRGEKQGRLLYMAKSPIKSHTFLSRGTTDAMPSPFHASFIPEHRGKHC